MIHVVCSAYSVREGKWFRSPHESDPHRIGQNQATSYLGTRLKLVCNSTIVCYAILQHTII